jgi:hypothetical protein
MHVTHGCCCCCCRLADLKLKEAAFQMLLAASEAVGPQLVASLLHKRAAAHKNPKVGRLLRSCSNACYSWLARTSRCWCDCCCCCGLFCQVMTAAINWTTLAVNEFLLPAFSIQTHILISVAAAAVASSVRC